MITRRSVWIVTLKILTDAYHQSVYSENPNGYDKKNSAVSICGKSPNFFFES